MRRICEILQYYEVSDFYPAYHSLIHRFLHIPLNPKTFSRELDIIKQIANANGYSEKLINTILERKLRKLNNSKLYPVIRTKENSSWCKLPFIGNISYKLANLLTQHNIKPAFYTTRNLGKILLNNKNNFNYTLHSGVYKLQCNDCNAIYLNIRSDCNAIYKRR